MFIGGDSKGKITELKIDGYNSTTTTTEKRSRASQLIHTIKDRVIGSGSKMKKLDKSALDDSVMKKIFGGFFERGSKYRRYVASMTDGDNALFVAVNDERESSEIEIYDIQKGDEFKLIRRITLTEVL